MSSANNGLGCPDGRCEDYMFNQYVTTPFEREHVMHVFMGENPGGASSTIDQFGNSTSRYGIGGRAQNFGAKNWIVMRGTYWGYYQHPNWSAGGVLNNANSYPAFSYIQFLMAHELGHNLGLEHEHESFRCTATAQGKSNNLMNYPGCDGYSLTPCQIGLVHQFLRNGVARLDDLVVQPGCELAAAGDVVVTGQEEWRGPRSIKGNLYVEAGAELRIRCRAEFMAPQARIVVREGGELIIDGGTLAGVGSVNYRCNDPLELLLGGDPNKAADADNGGLIRITNRGGLFEGENLLVQLTPKASLRLDATELAIDRATFVTQPESYLCVDPEAVINPGTKGRFVVEPGTVLKLNPVIQQSYGECMEEPCRITQSQFSFLNPFQHISSPGICNEEIALRVTAPTGLNVHYSWTRNGVGFGPDAPEAQDTPPVTSRQTVTYTVEISVDGCPPFTLTHSGYVRPVVQATLSSNTVNVCASAAFYDLTQLNPRLSTWPNGTIRWYDLDPSNVIDNNMNIPGHSQYELSIGAALLKGRRQVALKMAYRDDPDECERVFDFIVNLVDGPAVSAGPDKTTCPGQPVTLTATGSAAGYVWMPGNLQGASITVTPTAATTYTVATVGNPGGCESYDQVKVSVTPPDCAPCRPSTNQLANPVYTANPFVAGKSYHVTQNVRFELGTFTIPENTTVYCDPGVTLTVGYLARLELLGGRITAPCSGSMWGGLVVQPDSRGLRAEKGPGGGRPEISHSYDGVLLSAATGSNPPAVQIENTDFRHNRTSLSLSSEDQGAVLSGFVRDCTFDSNPQEMQAPMLSTATNPQWSYRHILAAGPMSGVDISNNHLRNALVGVWKTRTGTLTLNNNEWRNCYIAGIYAQDAMGTQTFSNNRFYFYEGPSSLYAGAYVYDAYATLPENPMLLRPGAAYGFLGHSVGAIMFSDNLFQGATQADGMLFYSYQNNPKVGICLFNGTGHVQRSTFVNLYQGYVGPANQNLAEIKGNLFENCRTGIRFRNLPQGGPAGVAEVTCNTFQRTVSSFYESYGIVRDFCAGPGYPCNQIDIRDLQNASTPTLVRYELRNQFIPVNEPNNPYFNFIHLYNGPVNSALNYCTTNDYIDNNRVKTNSSAAVTIVRPTDTRPVCSAQGFSYGLRPASNTPSAATVTDEVMLAQNVPNPFDQETRIAYRVPGTARQAELQVRDNLSGKLLRTVPLEEGQHEVVLRLSGLLPGVYHYQLVVDGVPRAHRRLVLAY
jgi:Metallo-peptidase family M12B Reprolysin-like